MGTKNPFTILIIEDDIFMLDALRTILEDEGYKIHTAENGLVALGILEREPHPDLILLDMVMPKMNGWDFAEAYKKFENPSPIVVITGAADVVQRAKDVGAGDWLAKPYAIDDILKKIEKFTRGPKTPGN